MKSADETIKYVHQCLLRNDFLHRRWENRRSTSKQAMNMEELPNMIIKVH